VARACFMVSTRLMWQRSLYIVGCFNFYGYCSNWYFSTVHNDIPQSQRMTGRKTKRMRMNYGEIKSFTEATALGISFFHSVLHIVSVVSSRDTYP
jgi:hypothetical protein